MPPEPVPTMAEVLLAMLIIWGGVVLIVLTIIAVFTAYFWAREQLDDRARTHRSLRDRRIDRYRDKVKEETDWLFSIPHEGEWPSWPSDREASA